MGILVEIYRDEGIPESPGSDLVIERVISECARAYKETLCAGVYLTDDTGIREKNLRFRNKDAATDVLSFPLLESKNGKLGYTDADRDMERDCVMAGDIIISMDRVLLQAVEYGHPVDRELAFLVCHGMLHLLGYDHETQTDEMKMLEKQEKILNTLGYTRQEET